MMPLLLESAADGSANCGVYYNGSKFCQVDAMRRLFSCYGESEQVHVTLILSKSGHLNLLIVLPANIPNVRRCCMGETRAAVQAQVSCIAGKR